MAATQILHRIRPGTLSDVNVATDLYLQSFNKETLLDYMFPGRHEDPAPLQKWVARRFRLRYWAAGYVLTMLDDAKGEPVAFSWWHIPDESVSFTDRWLSLHAWVAPLIRAVLKLHSYLFPIRGVDPHRLGIYDRVFSTIEPEILNSPRRRSAWYLSSLSVSPEVQGSGYGSLLLQNGLEAADRAGVPTWLVGLRGLDQYYKRFGFLEVARANVGELKDWDGGIVMFRGE
ncbi:hypothetical protein SNK03_003289 [Fusarium graminearum]|uniref:Chromosome 1, complete genome n=4 Tax=Fusarium sambucinum species complex TaxID=569360 RepID=I1RZT9_GIBZE|nr:hypothetical protein FGSG_09944 [Fusarium graminearum PH-1]EYB26944.1 hypothetical protein FG05_09944 [Fusarium graminearum]KAF5236065.1 hypothetical protein FAUST_6741 [Fusarium austroamericanum]QPC68493.1 hypothetical protein HYE67_010724 [Fusarium culmorum]ESU16590.1 hypothetical protein FGSG_09944 [Fusarium graminearum PH-1]KAI6749170.1 hypothetical protein HG531_008117 [Fusarium graminearum]|eukprot:XP_011318852.1 hypothetical protein FGSG_09944 [Fusarium graminearum PH-1]